MTVEFSAREAHFADHLAPIWHQLPAELRGTFWVDPGVVGHAQALGLPAADGWPRTTGGPVVVASAADLRVVSRTRRPVVLAEHGAGQHYSNRHPSYVGGRGRDHVRLFLAPNQQAAARNRRYWPTTPQAVIGCPKLDTLRRLGAGDAVTLSFHWRCRASPEAGTAFDDFAAAIPAAARTLRKAGLEVLGHGHPRILDDLRSVYEAAGIETVHRFDEVVARSRLYAVDNSSTLFEFAALGRPVVLLNARRYRRNASHGLRFWDEAGVGLNVDRPDRLAATILRALDDPPVVRESREASIGRVYPVADGTSAALAAEAILRLMGRRCLLCGADHASCGPTTDSDVAPVDHFEEETKPVGPLKRYPNPDRPGAFLNLDEASARRLGLGGPPDPAPEVLSSDVAGGENSKRKRVTPVVAEEKKDTTPMTPEPEPKDKARPAPPSRRRRRVADAG